MVMDNAEKYYLLVSKTLLSPSRLSIIVGDMMFSIQDSRRKTRHLLTCRYSSFRSVTLITTS